MKYFAKYLPVEGEIGEDDYIYEKSLSDVSIHKVYKRNDELVFFRFTNVPIKLSKANNPKKVKLFLCNRDIEIGDKFIVPDHYLETYDTMLSDEVECTDISEDDKIIHFKCGTSIGGIMHSGVFREENPYKIIGEISSKAIWVKEGDEFDEDEVEYALEVAFIKCPTCKTFH